jgi:hypothetical protein
MPVKRGCVRDGKMKQRRTRIHYTTITHPEFLGAEPGVDFSYIDEILPHLWHIWSEYLTHIGA